MAGYVNAVPAFVFFELPVQPERPAVSVILKIDLLRFHRIYLLFDWSKRLLF